MSEKLAQKLINPEQKQEDKRKWFVAYRNVNDWEFLSLKQLQESGKKLQDYDGYKEFGEAKAALRAQFRLTKKRQKLESQKRKLLANTASEFMKFRKIRKKFFQDETVTKTKKQITNNQNKLGK